MTAAWLFTAPTEPTEALEALTAPWMLPPWVSRERGTFLMTLLRVVGRELDRLRLQHRRIAAQAWIPSISFAATAWERQLGLRVRADLSLGLRRARALARKRGLQGPIGAYLQALVADAVAGTGLPDILAVVPGMSAVFKLLDNGWPGDAAFGEAERRLAESGPAAFGLYVAAYDAVGGLTIEQFSQMHMEAVGVLTAEEVGGA